MSRVIKVALLPFVLAWSLVRLLFWPAVILVVAWIVVPDGSGWFPVVLAAVAVYLLGAFTAFMAGARGLLRSLDRGTVHISPRERRSKRGQ
ncbi:putative RDD family membrane protein YckC [Saccharothrix ecbatanensis]|uniref:Putative RDD family membrane protein YckC n=1 Tax=Saccharothrix ecbatanensis TaxID=1105145 RepID=A0A7W9M6D2_9PSEU|nr:hypothetical protein [Saccharothrix ecbatanensis]MBB5808948.1 putative RDD family membrane protein YckC [Saccharothrix ecbatanensis]